MRTERGKSLSNLEEFWKRKREVMEDGEKGEQEEENRWTFQKSKRVTEE